MSSVMPRRKTVECEACGWQGQPQETDSGHCPECDGECKPLREIYGDDDVSAEEPT